MTEYCEMIKMAYPKDSFGEKWSVPFVQGLFVGPGARRPSISSSGVKCGRKLFNATLE